eukprot:TRINITY_DN1451_c0_g1_i1.p1 TRINITY_DN1451_c0_g1~~TRINITY_DN1451_c0_g1_i1.p1  ORF type:complete len:133 (-),score=25.58 TRINITY_DN1451_c0_g1_i1:11-409(-)
MDTCSHARRGVGGVGAVALLRGLLGLLLRLVVKVLHGARLHRLVGVSGVSLTLVSVDVVLGLQALAELLVPVIGRAGGVGAVLEDAQGDMRTTKEAGIRCESSDSCNDEAAEHGGSHLETEKAKKLRSMVSV